jgi:mono/diheme cytochrome c family protein
VLDRHRRSWPPALVAAAVALSALSGCGGGGGAKTPTPSPTAPASSAARGKALYTSLGCSSCHSTSGASGVGPTWKGLAGSRVKLTDGSTVTANDAYLLRSIENPDKQIVAGYQRGVMSGSVAPGSVSPSDAKALVAYIKSLG